MSAVNNVPGLSFPSTFSSVFSVAAHAIPEPEAFFLQPTATGGMGSLGRRCPCRLKDGSNIVATATLRRAAHVRLVRAILSKHPGLTPFEVKSVLAAGRDDPAGEHPRAA